jgi:hypothetical protein
VASFRQVSKLFVERELSGPARSAKLAAFARTGLAELIASGKASPSYRRFVDGREGAQESDVRPDGVILYEFSYIAEAVLFAITFLQGRSPVRSGRFRESFIVAVDGRPIPARQFQPRSVPLTAEVIIYNKQPYSRKVDVQTVGGRRLRFSTPAGLFDDCARAMKRRFGNSFTAKRLYSVAAPGQYVLRRGPKKGRRVDSPAVVITPLE